MGGIGGGLTLHATAGNVSLDPYGEVVQQSFRNSSFRPLATGLSGTLSTVGLQASRPITSGLAWQSRIAFARANEAATSGCPGSSPGRECGRGRSFRRPA